MAQHDEHDGDAAGATCRDDLQELLAAGSIDMRFDDGRVRIVFTSLPGRTVCTAAMDECNVLWIALDDGKPWCRGHAAEMLADVLAEHPGLDLPRIMEADLRRIPTQGTHGRARLALVQ